jgi:hypothetical protein
MAAFAERAPGDPKKAAAALLTQQVDAWEALSVGTNFDEPDPVPT